MNVIGLSNTEIRMCYAAAADQNIYNKRVVKAKPRYGAGNNSDHQYSIEGIMGHFAFCKWKNIFYDVNFSAIDAGIYEVRTHAHDYLILHKEDRDDCPFVSVRGMYGEYTIDGWVWGRYGKDEKYWGDVFKKNRPAYFIPRKDLCPIVALPEPGLWDGVN